METWNFCLLSMHYWFWIAFRTPRIRIWFLERSCNLNGDSFYVNSTIVSCCKPKNSQLEERNSFHPLSKFTYLVTVFSIAGELFFIRFVIVPTSHVQTQSRPFTERLTTYSTYAWLWEISSYHVISIVGIVDIQTLRPWCCRMWPSSRWSLKNFLPHSLQLSDDFLFELSTFVSKLSFSDSHSAFASGSSDIELDTSGGISST